MPEQGVSINLSFVLQHRSGGKESQGLCLRFCVFYFVLLLSGCCSLFMHITMVFNIRSHF